MTQVAKKETRKDVAREGKSLTRYRPATDILEREDGFYIYVDLPGVKKQDLTIDLHDDELTVTGRVCMTCVEGERAVDTQFGDCEYVRSVSISDIIDRDRIKANLDNGVLELHLPKVEKILPRRIEIQQA